MDIEDDMLEENDELITYFDLFEMWVRLTLEHQVDIDSYEGKIGRIDFLPFDVVENSRLLLVCSKLQTIEQF